MKTIAALLRAFEKNKGEAPAKAARAIKHAQHLLSVGINLVIILVPTDDGLDCGLTAGLIRQGVTSDQIRVEECAGNQNTAVLNRGVEIAVAANIDLTFIVSGMGVGAITAAGIEAAKKAFINNDGLDALGFTFNEDTDPFVLAGFLQNTALVWRTRFLMFNSFTADTGCEEVKLLVQIKNTGGRTMVIKLPPQSLDIPGDRMADHLAKLESKWRRIDKQRGDTTREEILDLLLDTV